MTDDLTTRLRLGQNSAALEAADRIEALETERASLIEAALDHRATASRALERERVANAVIAEALAVPLLTGWDAGSHALKLVREKLSRVPQGAAEPEHPYGIDCSEKCRRDAAPSAIDGLHEQYPEVAPFVTRMLRELWANRGKGDQAGWRAMTLRQAWSEIAWHAGKMTTAIKSEDWPLVRELAADIANGAMMLDDIVSRSTEPAELPLDSIPWNWPSSGGRAKTFESATDALQRFEPREGFEQDPAKYPAHVRPRDLS